MKEKIKNEIKTNWNKFGLTENQIDGLAIMLSPYCPDEGKVSEVVKSAEYLMRNMQSDNDKAKATEKAYQELEARIKGLEKPNTGANGGVEDGGNKGGKKTSEEDDFKKKMLEMMGSLQSELTSLKTDKLNASRKSQVSSIIKDLPASVKSLYESQDFGKYSDEEFNNVLADVKRSSAEIQKDLAPKTFRPPFGGGNNSLNTEDKPSEAQKEKILSMMNLKKRN